MRAAGTGLSYLRGQIERPLFTMMSVVGLVLLLACANLANLMLARATDKREQTEAERDRCLQPCSKVGVREERNRCDRQRRGRGEQMIRADRTRFERDEGIDDNVERDRAGREGESDVLGAGFPRHHGLMARASRVDPYDGTTADDLARLAEHLGIACGEMDPIRPERTREARIIPDERCPAGRLYRPDQSLHIPSGRAFRDADHDRRDISRRECGSKPLRGARPYLDRQHQTAFHYRTPSCSVVRAYHD